MLPTTGSCTAVVWAALQSLRVRKTGPARERRLLPTHISLGYKPVSLENGFPLGRSGSWADLGAGSREEHAHASTLPPNPG